MARGLLRPSLKRAILAEKNDSNDVCCFEIKKNVVCLYCVIFVKKNICTLYTEFCISVLIYRRCARVFKCHVHKNKPADSMAENTNVDTGHVILHVFIQLCTLFYILFYSYDPTVRSRPHFTASLIYATAVEC